MIGRLTSRKARIYLVTISLALAAILVGIAVNLQIKSVLEKNLLEQFVEQEALVADQVASNLVTNVDSVRDKLTIAASLPQVATSEAAICQEGLEEVFLTMESKVGNLGRVDANGYFACSLNESLVGVQANQLGEYIDDIFEDPAHRSVMSRSIYPEGANSHLVAIHVPVYNEEGEFDGTLGGALYFNEIEDKLLNDVRFAQNGFVVLFDDNGDILYHPEKKMIGENINTGQALKLYDDTLRRIILSEALVQDEGRARYFAGGVEKLAAYQTAEVVPGRQWIVLVTVPVTEAQSALTAVGLDAGFMAFTIVFTVAIFAIALAALISRLQALEVEVAKDEFLQLTTHQLQTPITSIRYFLEMLLEDEKKGLNDSQIELLEFAYEATKQQKMIVDDLLSVARLESGRLKLELSKSNIVELVQKVIRDHKLELANRDQTLTVEAPEQVVGVIDVDRIRMVLSNLLSNASKYTSDGGSIEITVSEERNKIIISVRDTGVGIPSDKFENLFKRFSRIDNSLSKSRGGTGLGLYIAKKIVELHGGRIKVDSEVGVGTTFQVVLPIKEKG